MLRVTGMSYARVFGRVKLPAWFASVLQAASFGSSFGSFSRANYSHTASLNGYACAKDTPASRAAILQLAPLKSAKHNA